MREGPENQETGYFAVVSSPDLANTMIISVQLCIAVHGACTLCMMPLKCSLGPNVSLVVVDAELSVTEPDPGDSSSITQCFTADLIEPLDSDAFIPLILSTASTTATQSADFLLNTSVLILPANFTGEFITCVEFEVFSDEIAEGNETIVFEASSQVTSSFVINILDNEDIGTYNICMQRFYFKLLSTYTSTADRAEM